MNHTAVEDIRVLIIKLTARNSMGTNSNPPDAERNSGAYRAYLLRLWCVKSNGPSWRAMLLNVETGEKMGFSSLDSLIGYFNKLREEGNQHGKESEGEVGT